MTRVGALGFVVFAAGVHIVALFHDLLMGKDLVDYGLIFFAAALVSLLFLIICLSVQWHRSGPALRVVLAIGFAALLVVDSVCFWRLGVQGLAVRFEFSGLELVTLSIGGAAFALVLALVLWAKIVIVPSENQSSLPLFVRTLVSVTVRRVCDYVTEDCFGVKAKGFVINFAFMSVVVGIGLVAMEAGWRILHGEPLGQAKNYVAERHNMFRPNELGTPPPSRFDSLLGWSLRPFMGADFYTSRVWNDPSIRLVTTGEYGVRMHSREIKPVPRGGVLAVGDSFTAGSEVHDRESWPAYLEEILDVPVANAASGGWGVDQMVLRAEQMIPRLNPHTLIVSAMVEDVLRNEFKVYGSAAKPYFLVEDGKLVHKNSPVEKANLQSLGMRWWHRVFGYSFLIDWFMSRNFTYLWSDSANIYIKADADGVETSCLLLKRLKGQADERGIRMIFLLQFGMAQVKDWSESPSYGTGVMKCVREYGIEALDFWPEYQRLQKKYGQPLLDSFSARGGYPYGHHSALGNRHVAEILVKTFWPEVYEQADGLRGDDWLK